MNSKDQPITLRGGWRMHIHPRDGYVFRHPAQPDTPPTILDFISRIEDTRIYGEFSGNPVVFWLICPKHEAVKVYSFSAHCKWCGDNLGWWCDESPDHRCHYDNGDEDSCDFCGEPEERK